MATVKDGLVLSLFPGIGLLDMAFEEAGFCVVRGPDLLWGGDIHRFHPPAGCFAGVIGGPPCPRFSTLAYLNGNAADHPNLIPEYGRCVVEAAPAWFLMENVPAAPVPIVLGYETYDQLIQNRWLGESQSRTRRFTFGSLGGINPWPYMEWVLFENPEFHYAVLAGHDGGPSQRQRIGPYSLAQMAALQGLPANFLADAPFNKRGKQKVIGNGVPLPMGRAIAQAVRRALATQEVAA